jgi:hypothetical protein
MCYSMNQEIIEITETFALSVSIMDNLKNALRGNAEFLRKIAQRFTFSIARSDTLVSVLRLKLRLNMTETKQPPNHLVY